MPLFLQKFKEKFKEPKDHPAASSSSNSDVAPPKWAPAPEISYQYGKHSDAPDDEYKAGEEFCNTHRLIPPRLLPSHIIDRIQSLGGRAWGIEYPSLYRFSGTIFNDNKGGPGVVKVQTTTECGDVCLMSDLPILAGLYGTHGKTGVYCEVQIHHMNGFIAVGTACRPYPEYRLPGWNRQSAGLHLDDMRKFFEDPDGGRDYTSDLTQINSGDTIGCGYEFATGSLFYTYNGCRLPNAFKGLYLPRQNFDVFAAVGVEEGNEWAWKIEGHVGGNIAGGSGLRGEVDEELPGYTVSAS